jgi:ParB-like chromosome segregation protein Spo0J
MSLQNITAVVSIAVNPAFEVFLPALDPAEYSALEKSIVADGIEVPIVVWRRPGTDDEVFVDGHNRWRIANEYGLLCPIKELVGPENENEVKVWMIDNQVARRNLSPQKRALYIGTLYNELKGSEPGIAEKLAEQYGEDERTVRRHAEVAKAVEKKPKLRKQFLDKEVSAKEIVKNIKSTKPVGTMPADGDKAFLQAVSETADKILRTISNLRKYSEDLDLLLMTRSQSVREYAPEIASLHAKLQSEEQEAKVLKTLVKAPEGSRFGGREFITESQYESVTA